ncbi:MAG: thiamine-monophosphate kinase, partial [Phycisphaerae bacterium]|nr:thiamine-monophosphate kinase [Phycisphaerae bacterium]
MRSISGVSCAGDEFNCPVAGGDVAVWDWPLAITVAVLARADGIEPVLRSGAEPGDAICLTGAVGGA